MTDETPWTPAGKHPCAPGGLAVFSFALARAVRGHGHGQGGADQPGRDLERAKILVTETVEVAKGATLTIEPGTIVRFKHYRGYKQPGGRPGLMVGGMLRAVGTPDEQIWFTSDAADPVNGDWNMLRFIDAGADSVIEYAVVEFTQRGINIWKSPTISHTIVRWNNWERIYLESCSKPLLEYDRIYENGYNGVAMEQFNDAVLRYCTIARSGTCGVHVDASTCRVERCIISGNKGHGLSVDDHAVLTALDNTLEGNDTGIG